MQQTVMTVWVAGLMMGTGAGLIVARSLPASSSVITESPVVMTEPEAAVSGFSSLLPPQQFPSLLPENHSGGSPNVEAQKTSAPTEPRLLPKVEASPVTQNQPASPTGPQANNKSESFHSVEATQLSEFREGLQELDPTLPEAALKELERIRAVIDAQPDKPALQPASSQADGAAEAAVDINDDLP